MLLGVAGGAAAGDQHGPVDLTGVSGEFDPAVNQLGLSG
jgi:hypothetical protein